MQRFSCGIVFLAGLIALLMPISAFGASPEEEGARRLEEITVVGTEERESYQVEEATSATKSEAPIMEIPASIQAVPQEVLEDQQVIRPREAVKNVSGVYAAGGNGNTQDNFIIRGFRQHAVYQDGFRQNYTVLRETAHLERIEVLKGPASVLYGRIEPGGLINLVSKSPLSSPYYSLQQQIGSFDFYRTTLDATGPLGAGEALAYRLNLAYEDAGSFRDFAERDRLFAAPVLSWKIGDALNIRFDLEYLRSDLPFDRGLIAIDGRPSDLPIDRRFEEPFSRVEQDYLSAGFLWSYDFNPDWTLRHRFKAEFGEEDRLQVEPVALMDDRRSLSRSLFEEHSGIDIYFTALELTGKVHIGGMRHLLLLGVDYYRSDNEGRVGFADFTAIDIFNPVYGSPAPDIPLVTSLFDESWFGVYLQDQIDLRENLHLLGGVRYDSAESGFTFDTFSDEDSARRFSPRLGLVYRPRQWLSLYASYAESFAAFDDFTRTAAGNDFDPQTATQYEAGVKSELWEGRLFGSLAFYDLTKENIPAPDPDNPGFSLPIGEARSRGVELDVTGEITPAWSLIASYAYTDAEVTEDTGGQEGRRLGAPRHGGSLWTRYRFLQAPLRGLHLGAGVFAVGARTGDLFGFAGNDFNIPGYTRADAMVAYRWEMKTTAVTAQLNVENIFDREYIAAVGGSSDPAMSLTPGAPRTVVGSIRAEF